MKFHIGADTRTGLIHSAVSTAANVHDSRVLGDLLHGKETRLYGDSAYRGQKEVIRHHAPRARDFTNARAYRNRALTLQERETNRRKSSIRAKVEHPFLVLKRLWGMDKTRYRGLIKNHHRLVTMAALYNMKTAGVRLEAT